MLRLTRFSGAFDILPAYELNSLLGHHAADALLARHDAGPPHPGVEGTVAVGAALVIAASYPATYLPMVLRLEYPVRCI